MNLKNKLLSGVVATAAAFFIGVNVNTHSAHATSINYNYALGYNQGSPYQTANKVIVAHETANPNATAENNAIFENNNWYSSGTYVQYIVGADNQGHHGRIFAVGAEGYQAWGAGSWANANAPVQIELAETYDKAGFKQDYATYVNLLRSSAKKYGIPTTFDSAAWTGIKSHNWISNNVWGDHTDPFGYLAKMGISRAQFKYDVEHGISNSNSVKPTPKPSNKKQVDITYALHQRGGSWYPDVKNFGSGTNGYAGAPYLANDLLYIKVNRGSIKYRVHTIEDGWLPWIHKANKNDTVNGVAGIKGHTIDGVQIVYTTPKGETYQQAYYRSQSTQRSGYLGACADNGTVSGFDSWAGMYGEPLDRLQISIGDHNNF